MRPLPNLFITLSFIILASSALGVAAETLTDNAQKAPVDVERSGEVQLAAANHLGPVLASAQNVETLFVYGDPSAGGGAGSATGKMPAPLVETPISATDISYERLETQNIANVSDILKYVAGGRDRNGTWEHSDGYVIRGFDQSSYMVWDGQLRNDPSWWAASEPFTLEKASVVKGPASVMYGKTAPGGVVAIRSKRPGRGIAQEIQLQVGSYDEHSINLDVNSELNASGSVLGRIVGSYLQENDQIDYVDFERKTVLPTLKWEISDTTDITFITLWQQDVDDNNDGLPAMGTIKPNPNGQVKFSTYTGEPSLSDNYTITQYSFGYELNHQFSDSTKFTQNFRHFRVRALSDNYMGSDGFRNMNEPLPEGVEDNREPTYDYRTVNRYRGSYLYFVNNWQVDNSVVSEFTTGAFEHTVMGGLEYSQLGQQFAGSYGDLSPLDLFAPSYGTYTLGEASAWNGAYDTTQTALYLQDQIKFREQYVMLAALRADDSKSTDIGEWAQNGKATAKDTAVTGRIGFMYLGSAGLSPYVSYSTSFLPVVGQTVEGDAFVPEEAVQHEVGLKWGDAGDTVHMTMAAFDITRENILTRHPTIDGAQVQNGSQNHTGFELETHFALWDRWFTTLTYAWLDAEITESFDPGVKGNTPQEVPETTASLWSQYHTLFNPDLSFTFGISHESFTYGDPENTVRQHGFTIFEAGAHYTLSNWNFSLTGTNLTNEKYFSSCWNGNYCARSEPRLVSLRASYKW